MTFRSLRLLQIVVLVVLVALCLSSCKEGKYEDTLEFGYEYQPLNVGQYAVYDVDSINYNFILPSTQMIDTFRYQLMEYIADTFYDNQSRLNYRVELYTRTDTAPDWKILKVWYAIKTSRAYERQEDDLRFMKLVFPIKDDISWNGNIYLPVNDTDFLQLYSGWNYTYKETAKPAQVNGLSFQQTVRVNHVDQENLIDKKYGYELYAKNVGQIFKRLEKINKQDVSSSWDDPYMANGFRCIKKIVSYGP